MTSLRKFSDKELSAQLSRADEQFGRKLEDVQKQVETGLMTPEQSDFVYQDILDQYRVSKSEIEQERSRRDKNRISRNKIVLAIGVTFAAAITYFLFFK